MEDGSREMRNGLSEMSLGVAEMDSDMQKGKSESRQPEVRWQELVSAHKDPQAAYDDLSETIAQMKEVRDAIPGMFDEAEANYLAAIDEEADTIQATYQQTPNTGFKDMAVFVAICAIIGVLPLTPYREKAPKGTM